MSLKHIPKHIIRGLYRLSTAGLSKGAHVTRYSMYRYLAQYTKPRPQDLRVLSVSGSEHLAKLLGFHDQQISNASYPEFNILSLPFDDGEFDAIVSDQVLEHVEGSPQAAMNEMFRVLKPGGLALHTTCLINPVHGCPNDYWRFTPEALKLMTKDFGEALSLGGWGNFYVWLFAGLGLRLEPIPHARWHFAHYLATRNDPEWPIVTWALVKKSAQE